MPYCSGPGALLVLGGLLRAAAPAPRAGLWRTSAAFSLRGDGLALVSAGTAGTHDRSEHELKSKLKDVLPLSCLFVCFIF